MSAFRTLCLLFIGGLISSLSYGASAEEGLLTAIATQSCSCVERRYVEQEYEAVALRVKKGTTLGRFCSRLDEAEGMKQVVSCRTRVRGFEKSEAICPVKCVKLSETPRLQPEEREKRRKAAIERFKGIYRKTLPQKVFESLSAERPNWLPVFYVSGEDGYEWVPKPYSRFYFESPRVEGERLRSHAIVFFHESNSDSVEEPAAWIGVFEKETGKPLKWIDYPPMGTYSDATNRNGRVVFEAGSPPAFYLRITESGVFDEAQRYYGPIGASAVEADADPERFLELPENPSVIADRARLIDGPAVIRSSPSVGSKRVGVCANNSLVLLHESFSVNRLWFPVSCDSLTGWTHRKNIR
jgi:hypothetical protein